MTTRTARRTNRSVLIAAAATAATAAAALAVVGAVRTLTHDGPQPWEAMPATTAAFVAIDADPAVSQKVEAVKLATLIGARDTTDAAKSATTALLGDIPSSAVLPWAGDRAAAGVATATGNSQTPVTFRVVAVDDAKQMRTKLTQLRTKRTPDKFGFAPVGTGWVLLADDQRTADELAATSTRTPLSADSGLQDDLAHVAKARLATAWVDLAKLDQAVTESLDDSPLRRLSAVPGVGTGAATGHAVLGARLDDGALQVDVHATGWKVGDRPAMPTAATSADLLASLPAKAVAGAALAQPAEYAQGWFASLPKDEQDRWQTHAKAMGIRLPDDFAAALGSEATASLVADGDTSGIVVKTRTTDPFNGFHAVQSFTQQYLFPNTGVLWASELDGSDIITGTNPTVVATAKSDHGLGKSAKYRNAVPARGPATFVAYIDIPALVAAAGGEDDPENSRLTPQVKARVAGLKSAGVWVGPATQTGDVDASIRVGLR